MAQAESFPHLSAEIKAEKPPLRPWVRAARYVAVRTLTLLVMFVIGLYIAIVVSNLGGYIDEIYRDRIDGAVQGAARSMTGVTQEERTAALAQLQAQLEEAYGLNQPFLLRCARWLWGAITLEMVNTAVREAFPNTLLLVSTSYLILFLTATGLALSLSRRYGSLIDRLVTALSPLSAAPSWVHGIILVAIFAVELRVLPFNSMYDPYPAANWMGQALIVLKHMVLPVTAILLSAFFQCVYAWRTFFLIHSSEDYVELAKAKGLPDRVLERRYILRPALSYFVTSFALLLVSFWQESIALEYFFSWPGIGNLYIRSTMTWSYSTGNIIGILVVFAYALAVTVFILDISYALLDPRIRLGEREVSTRLAARKEKTARPQPGLPREAVPRHVLAPLPAGGRPAAAAGAGRRGRRPREGGLWGTLGEVARFPSAIVGVAIILAMAGVSAYTVIALPYDRAVELWQMGSWRMNPRGALPAWVNWFRRDKLPETAVLGTVQGTATKEARAITEEMSAITVTVPLDYPYQVFPQDVLISITASYAEKLPLAYLSWITPDGRQIPLDDMQLVSAQTYVVAQDQDLARKLGRKPVEGLFADPAAQSSGAIPGRYSLRVKAFCFEPASDVEVQMIVYGRVYGLAGTDINRRDLMVALLWGTPVALGLGLLGAVGSTLIAITVAAVGVWFGGWVDRAIQWVSEVNMLLPVLPLAIMVYFRYTKNIWAILAVIIVLSSFGRALKNLRAALLPVREQPYIEAAQSYGAGHGRIILRYLLPRVIPVLVPQLVIMIPGFVFLEATLAIVGVSDLYLPTWGKVIYDALTSGIVQDHYYLVLEPIALLMVTGLAFAMLGYSLDRVFNPRLRSMRGGG